MKKIKNIIREVLNEEMGVQTEIKDMSKLMASWILESLLTYHKIKNPSGDIEMSIPYPRVISKETAEKTEIGRFKVNFLAKKGEVNKVGGKFSSKNLFRMDVGSYIEIDVNVVFENDVSDLEREIISVINHELNHALVYLKKYDKPSRLNLTNKLTLFGFGKNPELYKFIKMVYLTVPEEVQARVQEAGAILDEIDADNYHDAIRELYRFQSIKDASRMYQYKVDDVFKVDPKTLAEFVKAFRLNAKGVGDRQKTYEDVNKFFEHFESLIQTKGRDLNKKIFKLVANKFNNEDKLINEGCDTTSLLLYLSKDDDLFENIFGFGLNDYDYALY